MRGLNWKTCCGLVQKDAVVSSRNAAYAITISKNNKAFIVRKNRRPRLGIISIIGPGVLKIKDRQEFFEQAVLAEIGIGASRPYHSAKGLNQKPSQSEIPKRRKWLNLSKGQYSLIAPIVFSLIQGIALERISRRKNISFWLPSNHTYWSHRSKKLIKETRWQEWPRGVRFSFSKSDPLFLSDLYWAELQNPDIIYQVQGIAKFIDKRLKRYRQSYKGKKPFHSLKGAEDIFESIQRFSFYLRREVLDNLPQGKDNPFYHELRILFGLDWNTGDEKSLIQRAKEFKNPQERTKGIQLKITTGLEKKKDYVVFEVFLPIKSNQPYFSQEIFDSSSYEEVPF